jgi:hypothetical protein
MWVYIISKNDMKIKFYFSHRFFFSLLRYIVNKSVRKFGDSVSYLSLSSYCTRNFLKVLRDMLVVYGHIIHFFIICPGLQGEYWPSTQTVKNDGMS